MPINPEIRYYINGESVDETILNRPLTDIEANLNDLFDTVDGLPSVVEGDAGKYVRINDTGTGYQYTDIEFVLIRTPTPVYPLNGTTNVPLQPTLEGSPYSPIYSSDLRDYREFQVDIETGDFSTPIRSTQVNADSWAVTPDISDYPSDTLIWRCRDVGVDGTITGWSEVQNFSSGDSFVRSPSVSVQKDGNFALRAPVLTGSVFEIFGVSDGNHVSTDWRITRTSDSTVVWSSIGDTSNLESITVPDQTLATSTEYLFEVRYNSDIYGSSIWGSTTETTVSYLVKTPVLLGDTSGVEVSDHIITIDNYDSSLTYSIATSGGSYQRTGNTITWSLPEVTQDTTHQINVYASNAYGENSSTTSLNVTVLNIPTVSDDSVIINTYVSSVYNEAWSV